METLGLIYRIATIWLSRREPYHRIIGSCSSGPRRGLLSIAPRRHRSLWTPEGSPVDSTEKALVPLDPRGVSCR